jgi:predicted secreted protein
VPEHRLGMDDAGRTVEVAAGDRLVLSLPETAGTGYTWSVEDLPPGATVLEERYDLRPEAGIGGASQHVFVLSPPHEAGEVRLVHARPWEGASADAAPERFALAVTPVDRL